MNLLTKLLRNSRITDEDGSLSLTSVIVLVAVYRVLTSPVLTMEEVGLLLTAAATYTGKKVVNQRSQAADTQETLATVAVTNQALASELKDLKDRVQILDNRTRPRV